MKVYTLLAVAAFAAQITASAIELPDRRAAVPDWNGWNKQPKPSKTTDRPRTTKEATCPKPTKTTKTTTTTTTKTTTTTPTTTTTTTTTTTPTTTTTTTTTSAPPTCATESQQCDPIGTALPSCCPGSGLQCIQGNDAYFCRRNCLPDGAPCSLNDPGACCGQVCLVDGYCITIV